MMNNNHWRFIDIIGQRFGNWTVIERDGMVHPTRWLCQCGCGSVRSVASRMLRSGISTNCGCITKPYQGKPQGVATFNHLYAAYVNNARSRGITFELSKDNFAKLTKQNCYYCGCEPAQEKINYCSPKHGSYIYNGIDRLNNIEGYTMDNCVSCCGDCNKMKMCKSEIEFLEKIKIIYNNRVEE